MARGRCSMNADDAGRLFTVNAKYSIEKGSNGIVIIRHKKNIEIVHASEVKVSLKEFVEPKAKKVKK